jgi:hypothetical protein
VNENESIIDILALRYHYTKQETKNKKKMITSDQLQNVLEREQALRGYL